MMNNLTIDDFDQDLVEAEKTINLLDESSKNRVVDFLSKKEILTMVDEKSPLALVQTVQRRVSDLIKCPIGNYAKGRVFYVRNNLDDAETYFCYPEKKRQIDSLYFRAVIALEKNEICKCLEILDAMGPISRPEYFRLLGKYRGKWGDLEGAKIMLERAAKLQPEAYTDLGYLCMGSLDCRTGIDKIEFKNLERAKEYFYQGAKLGVRNCLFGMGIALEKSGEISLARKYYESAMEKGCKESWTRYARLIRALQKERKEQRKTKW